MDTLTVGFTQEKETENTLRFTEDGEQADQAVGKLYVKKSALGDARPERLTLTIEESDPA